MSNILLPPGVDVVQPSDICRIYQIYINRLVYSARILRWHHTAPHGPDHSNYYTQLHNKHNTDNVPNSSRITSFALYKELLQSNFCHGVFRLCCEHFAEEKTCARFGQYSCYSQNPLGQHKNARVDAENM